ncbi:MAG: MFS transporter [Alphaproteobacteria bacterium]|nr:MFS transporter [Alphaproteobacteria bacterium]
MSRPSAGLAQAFSNVGHSFSHILTILYPTVVLALEPAWGMTFGELIGLMIAGQILFGVMALPAGWLGDRWSMLAMMVLFFIGTGVAAVLTGLARNGLEMALGLAAIGIFASIYHPVGMAWLVREATNRGRALGINGIFGAAGLAAGPVIAGFLIDKVAWQAAFIVPGTVAVALGLALAVCWALGWVRESKADRKPQPQPARGDAVRAFIILSLTMLLTGFVGSAYMVMLPKVFAEGMADVIRGGALGAGAMVTIVYGFASLAQYVGGRLCDRHAMKYVYLAGFGVQAPLLFFAIGVEGWFLLPLTIVIVFAQVVANPAENGMLAYFTPGRWRATAYGAKFVLALGAAASAIPIIGWIRDTTGSFAMVYVVLGFMSAVVVLASLWLPNDRLQKEPAPAGAVQPAE